MKTSYTRIFAGLGVVLFGGLLLLDSLNINGFNGQLGTWWPLFVIGAGALVFLNDSKSYLWAILLIGFGGLSLLNKFEVVNVNPWQLFWPAIIIAVGLSIIFRQFGGSAKPTSGQNDDISAILGGASQVNTSADYKGGKITAILGGVELDLRKTVIKKDATIDIFGFMGGVELRVPENVVVKTKASAILGGIENKRQAAEVKNAPVLYITGQVIMAGIEIKR